MTNTITFKTKGMHCKSCELLLKDAIEEIEDVENVNASHMTGLVNVDIKAVKPALLDEIADKIRNEGFEVIKE